MIEVLSIVLWGAPAPYIKEEREEAGGLEGASQVGVQLGKGGVLLPEGVGLLLARLSWSAGPPPLNLCIWGPGPPPETQVDPRDHILSRMRCPLPP